MVNHGAIGDTYGSAFEFAQRSFIQKENTLTKSLSGKYTDNTQMAIGVAKLFLFVLMKRTLRFMKGS
jgi:ADP-ribosylglycohydrolase